MSNETQSLESQFLVSVRQAFREVTFSSSQDNSPIVIVAQCAEDEVIVSSKVLLYREALHGYQEYPDEDYTTIEFSTDRRECTASLDSQAFPSGTSYDWNVVVRIVCVQV